VSAAESFTVIRACRIVMAGLAVACSRGSSERQPQTPEARQVRIGRDVSLEVVDWGGRGPPLVFLAGLGNTAHVFDDFAPRFRGDFHVVGITRRGFGASSSATPPSDLDTLVADVDAVLDTLGFTHVVLVGHSIAGEEMTRWAELHPSRCAGLIYLDAAYDRHFDMVEASDEPEPQPRRSPDDFASIAALRAFHARVMGVREPESEIRATSRFDERGRYVGEVTPDSLKARVITGRRVANYDNLRCRSLAIYAVGDSTADYVPYYSELDARGRARMDQSVANAEYFNQKSRAQLSANPRAKVVELHGNHFVFLQQPDTVAWAMHTFLRR
jgi:pimeloyl-ACP methyl ester carboxylesterase